MQEFEIQYKTETAPVMEQSHIHRELELVMVLSDRVECRIGETDHVLGQNTLVLFNNFERHRLTVPDGGGYRRYVCLFLPGFLGTAEEEDPLACFFSRAEPDANLLPLTPAQAEGFKALLARMAGVYTLQGDAYARRLELQLLLKVLLLEVNRFHRCRCAAGSGAGGRYTRVSRMVEYIQGHLAAPLTLEELARQFAVSRTQLADEFKAVTGTSPRQYIIDCRVWHAAALLERGATVEEAGAAVGFSTLAHFSRSFKARVGQNPKQYSLAHRAG